MSKLNNTVLIRAELWLQQSWSSDWSLGKWRKCFPNLTTECFSNCKRFVYKEASEHIWRRSLCSATWTGCIFNKGTFDSNGMHWDVLIGGDVEQRFGLDFSIPRVWQFAMSFSQFWNFAMRIGKRSCTLLTGMLSQFNNVWKVIFLWTKCDHFKFLFEYVVNIDMAVANIFWKRTRLIFLLKVIKFDFRRWCSGLNIVDLLG